MQLLEELGQNRGNFRHVAVYTVREQGLQEVKKVTYISLSCLRSFASPISARVGISEPRERWEVQYLYHKYLHDWLHRDEFDPELYVVLAILCHCATPVLPLWRLPVISVRSMAKLGKISSSTRGPGGDLDKLKLVTEFLHRFANTHRPALEHVTPLPTLLRFPCFDRSPYAHYSHSGLVNCSKTAHAHYRNFQRKCRHPANSSSLARCGDSPL